MKKQYITADQLLADSMALAFKIIDSGYQPDLLVGIWRGGTPVAIAVEEVMELAGMRIDHIAIRTASYTGIAERSKVRVDGMEYIQKHLPASGKLLLVDDVYDTGLSIDAVIQELETRYAGKPPECRIATPWYKPGNNETGRVPDFYLHETADWLVFPHELLGLDDGEISEDKPLPDALKARLLKLR